MMLPARLILHLCRSSVILLLPLLAIGCNKKPAEAEKFPPAPVRVARAEDKTLGEWTELIGSTQPLPGRGTRIAANVEGQVLWVLDDGSGKPLEEGKAVSKGQVLVQLDDRIARANLNKVRANLGDLREQKKQADYAVELAGVNVKSLENLRPAGKDERDLPLVSRIELDRARIALKDARAKQQSAQEKVDAGEAEFGGLQIQLEYYKLRAPIAGRLGLLQVVPGQALAIGAPVADVIDLNEVDILCFVPAHTAEEITLNQPARLVGSDESASPKESTPGKGENSAQETPAGKETANHKETMGKVVFIAAQAQADTGNFPIKVRFANQGGKLRGNTVVRVEVQTKPDAKRLTIPVTALMEDQDPPVVLVVVEGNNEKGESILKIKRLEATVGVREGQEAEILELKDPEAKKQVPIKEAVFVVKGGHGLKNDDEVRIEEDKSEEK